MAKPSEHELELIKEIRDRIEDLDLSEEYLCAKNLVRFLRARNEQLDRVEDMIRKNVHWYEAQDVGNVLSWKSPSNLKQSFPWSIVGFDNLGGPLVLLPIGRWDPAACTGFRDEAIRQSIQYFETVWTVSKMKSKGKDHIPQFTIIIDLQGLGWRHYTTNDALQVTLTMVKYFEANYPDSMRLGVFVNAPAIFSMFWKLIKPMMSEVTRAKLHILGSDMKLWKKTICEYAPANQVPQYYGGTLPDGLYQISLDDLDGCKYQCQNGNECHGL